MVTFAIAVTATASLGLLAMRVPAVLPALSKFSAWAGLFMQVVGVFEALRRLAAFGSKAFNIIPAAPTVAFAGVTSTVSARPAPPLVNIPVSIHQQPQQVDPKIDDATETARREIFEALEEFVDNLTVERLTQSPRLAEKVIREVETFLHYRVDGTRDIEANAADPISAKALDLWYKVNSLISEAHGETAGEPLDASDVSIYTG